MENTAPGPSSNAAWFNINSTQHANPCSWKPRYLIQASNVTSRNTRPEFLPSRLSLLLSAVNRPSHPPAKPMITDSPFIQPTKKDPTDSKLHAFFLPARLSCREAVTLVKRRAGWSGFPGLAGSLPRQPRFRTGDAVPPTGVKAGRAQPLRPGAPGGGPWFFRATPPRGRGHLPRGF